jgi:hypothetical protein
VTDVLRSYGVSAEAAAPVVRALKERPEAWIDFMMRFELGLEQPDPKRALVSAVTIAGAYIFGGLIPLAPYFIFVFGCVKDHFTGTTPIRSPCKQHSLAAAAFGIAHAIA